MKRLCVTTMLLLIFFQAIAAETIEVKGIALTRFDAIPGSKIIVEGQGGISNWRAEGTLLGGFVEVWPGSVGVLGESTNRVISARAEVFIPVNNLRGVGESWEPYNEQRTSAIHKLLRAEEYPRILFRLKELVRAASSPSEGDARYDFKATGEIVIGGVTNNISMPIRVMPMSGGKLKISGTAQIKESDFNLIPRPRVVFEYIDRDTLNVVFEGLLAQKNSKSAEIF